MDVKVVSLFTFRRMVPRLLTRFRNSVTGNAFTTSGFLGIVMGAVPFLVLFPYLYPRMNRRVCLLLILIRRPRFFVSGQLSASATSNLYLVRRVLVRRSLLLILKLNVSMGTRRFPTARLRHMEVTGNQVVVRVGECTIIAR